MDLLDNLINNNNFNEIEKIYNDENKFEIIRLIFNSSKEKLIDNLLEYVPDNDLEYCLENASKLGNIEIVEWIVNQKQDINTTKSILYASLFNKIDVLKLLVNINDNLININNHSNNIFSKLKNYNKIAKKIFLKKISEKKLNEDEFNEINNFEIFDIEVFIDIGTRIIASLKYNDYLKWVNNKNNYLIFDIFIENDIDSDINPMKNNDCYWIFADYYSDIIRSNNIYNEDNNIYTHINFDIIRDKRDTDGKWMLFFPNNILNEKWIYLKKLYYTNKLDGITSMKCATNKPSERASSSNFKVIILYCEDSYDEDRIKEIGKNILKLTNYKEYSKFMYYKTNKQTRNGTVATGNISNHMYSLEC